MSLIPGKLAPDFTLDSLDNKGMVESLSLGFMKGKFVVLMFYPEDFLYSTPTDLFYASEPLLDMFSESTDCYLLAISTEHIASQVQRHAAPRSEAGLKSVKIRVAYDPTGDVAKKFGVYKEEENIRFRTLIIIDPEGKINTIGECDLPPVGGSKEKSLRQVTRFIIAPYFLYLLKQAKAVSLMQMHADEDDEDSDDFDSDEEDEIPEDEETVVTEHGEQ